MSLSGRSRRHALAAVRHSSANAPGRRRAGRGRRPEAGGPGDAERDRVAPPRTHLLVTGVRGSAASGVIGRPSLATAATGKASFDRLTVAFGAHLALCGEGNGKLRAPTPEPIPAGRDGAYRAGAPAACRPKTRAATARPAARSTTSLRTYWPSRVGA